MRAESLALAVGIALVTTGCKERGLGGKGSAEVKPKPGSAAAGSAVAPGEQPTSRSVRVVRDLAEEAVRAERDTGGLLIDLGTADAHKYTRGGWHSGWGRNQASQGTEFASIEDDRARLFVWASHQAAELVLRGRGGGDFDVIVDGRPAGSGKLGNEWGVARVDLERTIARGRHVIEIHDAKGADVDWIWLAAESGAKPPAVGQRTGTLEVAKQARDALVGTGGTAYAWYVQVPPHAKLTFAHGADDGGEFVVRAEPVAGGESEELYRATATGHWTSGEVDLSRFAGQGVRLELVAPAQGHAGWAAPRIVVPVGDAPPSGPPAKNLIVVLIDTARADAFKPFAPDGKGVGAAHFDAFAADSTVFRHAYDNSNWTKPSIATLFTSLYPESHNARWRVDVVPEASRSLAEHLSAHGFHTQAFVSNRSAGPKFGFDQGWDEFEKTGNAADIFAKATKWLDTREPGRFFLYVQSIDPHVPTDAPREYTKKFYPGEYKGRLGSGFEQSEEDAINSHKLRPSDDDVAWIRALYKGEVLYHDHYFGPFLDHLKETGLLDDTIVAVVNDHGEDLGEHGRFGHGWSTWEPLYRSPLTIHYPPLFPVTAIDDIVEQVDVAPTLVEALGVEPMPEAQGRSLLPLVHGTDEARGPRYATLWARRDRHAIRVGRYKLHLDRGREQGLYDVVADPNEKTDRMDDLPLALRMLEAYLGESLATYDKGSRLQAITENRVYEPGSIDDKARRGSDPETSE